MLINRHLVAQYVVAEDLLRHGGEERDGVGHRQAHLFTCISHLKQQSVSGSRLLSTQRLGWSSFSTFKRGFKNGKESRGGGRADLGITCQIVYLHTELGNRSIGKHFVTMINFELVAQIENSQSVSNSGRYKRET